MKEENVKTRKRQECANKSRAEEASVLECDGDLDVGVQVHRSDTHVCVLKNSQQKARYHRRKLLGSLLPR